MDRARTIAVYSDYKSPYAFLAKDLIYTLEEEFEVRIDWLPYTLDIPSYLGSARVDQHGYMDCRRQARKRGLTILGPRKIWNSSLAGIGMLWAKRQSAAVFRAYHNRIFERFWRRELDIEDPAVIAAVLAEAGADTARLANYFVGEGRREHDMIRDAAEAAGVFGVPSFLIEGELFWGREHLPDIKEMLAPRIRTPGPSPL
jgi:2-hydroxychromene-2-carboxylate isomerase